MKQYTINPSPYTDVSRFVTDDELEVVLLAFGRDSEDVTDEEFETAIDWAVDTRTENTYLDLVLSGKLRISVGPDGELRFFAKDAQEEPRRLDEDVARVPDELDDGPLTTSCSRKHEH